MRVVCLGRMSGVFAMATAWRQTKKSHVPFNTIRCMRCNGCVLLLLFCAGGRPGGVAGSLLRRRTHSVTGSWSIDRPRPRNSQSGIGVTSGLRRRILPRPVRAINIAHPPTRCEMRQRVCNVCNFYRRPLYRSVVSESFGESGSLFTAVGIVDISFVQDARDEDLADHLPFQQRCSTFHRDPNAVENRHVILLAAGY